MNVSTKDIKPKQLLQIIIIKPEQLLQIIIIKPKQSLQIIIVKPEQLLQIFIIKPEQLLLAPSSSPWPQWLIPKIIFTFFSSRNLFSNFKIAQLLKRIQIYFKLGLTVADEVRRYADI